MVIIQIIKRTTIYQWLMESDEISKEPKQLPQKTHENLNRFQPQQQLDKAVTKLFNLNKEKLEQSQKSISPIR